MCQGSTYEILHVFETLLIVSRVSKSTFKWNGFQQIPTVLGLLKLMANSCGIHYSLNRCKEAEANALLGIQTNLDQIEDSKMHMLEVIQRFIMILLVIENPKVFTLQYASKVIHGLLPPEKLKSKARRLYDVTNVLMAINAKFPILEKVTLNLINSSHRTAFMPSKLLQNSAYLSEDNVLTLPTYRNKHLLFDQAKRLLGILPMVSSFFLNLTLEFYIRQKLTKLKNFQSTLNPPDESRRPTKRMKGVRTQKRKVAEATQSSPSDESRRPAKRLKRERTQNQKVAEATMSNPPDESSQSLLKNYLKKRDYYGTSKNQRLQVSETKTSSEAETIPQVDESNAAKRVKFQRKAEVPQKRRFIESTHDESGFMLSYKVHVSPTKRSRGRPKKKREAETTIDESKFLLNYVTWDDIIITELSSSSTNCITVIIEESKVQSESLLHYVSTDDIIINDLSDMASKARRALQF